MATGLSASTIKSWFQYRCDRKTRYDITDAKDLGAVPVVKDQRDAPWAKLGQEFEDRIIVRLSAESSVLRPTPGDDGLPERLASAFLRGKRPEKYAAQVNLHPSARPAFLDPSGIDPRRTFADLIQIDVSGGTPVFRLIDVKATRRATVFQKAQVAYYALMLRAVLEELGVSARIDPVGEIWRIPNDGTAEDSLWTEDPFELGPYLRLVEEFCRRDLPLIAMAEIGPGRDETFFHLYFKCEQCEYLTHCRRSLERPAPQRDVSAVPGLSHEGKRALKRAGIRTVGALSEISLASATSFGGWSLQRHGELLVARAKAQISGQLQRLPNTTTYLMPPRAESLLVLSVDHDPVDDTLAALGYLYSGPEGERSVIEVLPDGSRAAEAEAIVGVLGPLIAELATIDLANAAVAEGDPTARYAHIVVYEPSEAINLQAAIGRHLDDPRIRAGLLDMVRLFPPETVVPEPEFKGVHHLPATAARSLVEQLYAVPALVSYDLRQISGAFRDARHKVRAYVPGPDFERPFSSLLSIDVIRSMREKRRREFDLEAVRQDVGARLAATGDVARAIMAENAVAVTQGEPPFLRLAKKPFRFQASFDPIEPSDLDVLYAFELLENRAGLLDSLIGLAQPWKQRRDAGRCLAGLQLHKGPYRRNHRIEMVMKIPYESRNSDIAAAEPGLILTDDHPDLRLNPQTWPLLECRLRFGEVPGYSFIDLSAANFRSAFFEEMMRRTGEGPWFVDRSFVDFNTGERRDYQA